MSNVCHLFSFVTMCSRPPTINVFIGATLPLPIKLRWFPCQDTCLMSAVRDHECKRRCFVDTWVLRRDPQLLPSNNAI